MNRDEMLEQLMALDFYTADMQLYLDTHPYDKQAICRFNAVAKEANNLRAQYEQMYGPLSARLPEQGERWQWIAPPWPWQRGRMPRLMGGER